MNVVKLDFSDLTPPEWQTWTVGTPPMLKRRPEIELQIQCEFVTLRIAEEWERLECEHIQVCSEIRICAGAMLNNAFRRLLLEAEAEMFGIA